MINLLNNYFKHLSDEYPLTRTVTLTLHDRPDLRGTVVGLPAIVAAQQINNTTVIHIAYQHSVVRVLWALGHEYRRIMQREAVCVEDTDRDAQMFGVATLNRYVEENPQLPL